MYFVLGLDSAILPVFWADLGEISPKTGIITLSNEETLVQVLFAVSEGARGVKISMSIAKLFQLAVSFPTEVCA